MVSLKIQLYTAMILLISEACSQQFNCCPQRVRCGTTSAPSTGSIIPGGQFIVPAVIKPLIPACQPSTSSQFCYPSNKQTSVSCDDNEDDCELDKLLYLLICNIIENKKGYGKKSSSVCESSSACDAYEIYASGYGEDDDCVIYGSGKDSVYTVPSCDNTCPEICVYLKPTCT